ncbi:MAG: rod shape-determining protein MreD [Clostridia bacterium]|nr:rod shape-determining protein MreD [Clostridia bacterium]
MNYRKDIIIKVLVVLFLAVITAALEVSVFSSLPILGTTPQLLIFLVAAVAVFEGPTAGVLCGLLAGIFMDGLGAKTLCWYTVASIIAALVIGVFSPLYFRRRIPTAMIWGAVFWLLIEFCRFFFSFYLFSEAEFSTVFTLILPQTLYSMVLSPLVIAPIARMHRKLAQEPGLFR